MSRAFSAVVGFILVVAVTAAQATPIDPGDWLVGGADGTVHHHNEDGTFVDEFSLGNIVVGLDFAPNGNAYAADRDAEVTEFAASNSSASSVVITSGLGEVTSVAADSGGHIYVGNKDPGVNEWDASFVSQGQYVNLAGEANPNDLVWGPDGRLYIGGNDSKVKVFDGSTLSRFDDGLGLMTEVVGLAFGSNGTLHVSDAAQNNVKRFQGPFSTNPGAYIDVFVTTGLGGLSSAQDCDFGSDGDLYVASGANNTIKRYDGTTGAYKGDFISLPGGTSPTSLAQKALPSPINPGDWLIGVLSGRIVYHFDKNGNWIDSAPMGDKVTGVDISRRNGNGYACDRDAEVSEFPLTDFKANSVVINTNLGEVSALTVGRDGHIYVGNKDPGVNEWNTSFVFQGQYVNLAGQANPNDLVWGPDDRLYIGGNDSRVRVYDGLSVSNFVTGLTEVTGIDFGADGNLYVADAVANTVTRFQGPFGASPGTLIGTFVSAGSGGLSSAQDCDFGGDGDLYVASAGDDTVKRYDGSTGAYLGDFATLPAGQVPIAIAQLPPGFGLGTIFSVE